MIRDRLGVDYFDSCPECYSTDNLGHFKDGGSWCFTPGCSYNDDKNHQRTTGRKMGDPLVTYREPLLPEGQYRALPGRGITEETCRRYGYHYQTYSGTFKKGKEVFNFVNVEVAVYNVKDEHGNIISQKLRGPNKTFKWIGGQKPSGLLGKDKWENNKNKVIITEGIEDMMAVAQATDYHMNVATLPDGAQSAEKIFEDKYEYDAISKHEQIIISFDEDTEGRKAVAAAKKAFPCYKLAVPSLGGKDACDILKKPEGQTELKIAIFKAEPAPPITLLRGIDVTLEQLMVPARVGFRIPIFPGLDYYLNGFAKRELTIWAGGTKLGKTDAVSRIEHALVTLHKQKIADIKVESDTEKNILQFIALELKIPFKVLKENPAPYRAEIAKAREKLMPYFDFYNQSGRCTPKKLLDLIYYCHAVNKVDFIVIDNLTKAISGAESSRDGERKDIDMFLSDLADFVRNTGVGVHLVVHLKNPERGRSWWQGKVLTDPGQMRGSGNIGNIGENLIFVGGQIQRFKPEEPFDRDVRYIGLPATREGRDSRIITDFYKLNKQSWEVETCECPWGDDQESEV